MREALILLSDLDEADVQWIFATGHEQAVPKGGVLTIEGHVPEALWIVLEGLFEVRITAFGPAPLARIGPGELVGEISLLTDEPATAGISAAEDALVLALTRKAITEKIADDPMFAARLYRSFARLGARRLQERVTEFAQRTALPSDAKATGAETAWHELAAALARFKALLAEADADALRNADRVPEATSDHVRAEFQAFVELLNRAIGDVSPLPRAVRDQLGARVRMELLPYVLLAELLERSYSKPRGYAGDFFTIHRIYEDRPAGTGRLGPLLDRCFLDIPTVAAVRNRRQLLASEVRREIDSHPDRPTQITSLACGPAREVFDVYEALSDRDRLRTVAVDIDFEALAFVANHRDRLGLRRQIRLEQSNLVYLALGREKLELPPQDLIYSIGLIDYFEDKFVILLLDYIHSLLAPGGRVILGNFHPRNSGKALADYALDWKLIHRTEDDMNRLFEASAFGRPCSRIVFEELGINLFAEGIREA